MTKIYLNLVAAALLLLSACSIDYKIKLWPESQCIIVNSILQPDSLITIRFYAMMLNDNKNEVIPLTEAHVRLEEDGTVLYDGISDSILRLNIYPKSGRRYAIEVSHADYPSVRATTNIPYPVSCKYDLQDGDFTLSDFRFPEHNAAPLFITCTALFDTLPAIQYGELYSNNVLLDPFNKEEGELVVGIGTTYYIHFLRIKVENQPRLTDIVFYPHLFRSIIYDGFLGKEIRLIAASHEYDRYCTTLYQQLSIPIDGSDLNLLLHQPVNVYNNIQGGLGIFAGKSDTSYFIEYNNE